MFWKNVLKGATIKGKIMFPFESSPYEKRK